MRLLRFLKPGTIPKLGRISQRLGPKANASDAQLAISLRVHIGHRGFTESNRGLGYFDGEPLTSFRQGPPGDKQGSSDHKTPAKGTLSHLNDKEQ